MTNQEILKIAMAQSAIDLCADPTDFEKNENVVVISRERVGARRYLKLPFSCQLVSYGSNVVASVSPEFREITENYIDKYPVEHLFETPHLHMLNDALMKRGQQICFMAEYFLPDVEALYRQVVISDHIASTKSLGAPLRHADGVPPLPQGEAYEWLPLGGSSRGAGERGDSKCYELRLLTQPDFADLYLPEWSNALCKDRKTLDVLGVGAYDGDRLVGLAGASADCETMWQIGIDVLPAYRRQGIASALTSRLAVEILMRGKVPFYCAAWCNIKSVRNALRSGFRPAWVEMTAKSVETVENMNAVPQIQNA